MHISFQTCLSALAGALLLCCSFVVASADIPPHLALARQVVDNIQPEDNSYALGGQTVRFPGDLFSSKYSVRVDCSGFVLALFERAKYSTQSRMAYLKTRSKKIRPVAEDFVLSIETEQGFTHIKEVTHLQPGDLLAHAMLSEEDQKQTSTTGHVFLVDSFPKKIAPRNPVVEGTEQFELAIIDSNEEHVGSDDSRLADPAHAIPGVGRGTIRIYADAHGALVGWARTFKNTNRFFSYSPNFPSDTKLRKAAMGRPVAGH